MRDLKKWFLTQSTTLSMALVVGRLNSNCKYYLGGYIYIYG